MPGAAAAEKTYEYGGFWKRFIAIIIDGLIIGIPFAILGFLTMGNASLMGIFQILQFVVGIGYSVYFVGKEGATPGKSVMGLVIIKTDGKFPIGYENAAIRYIGSIVSAIILGIGYLMIAFDPKKQGLHDKIAGTYVVTKESLK